MIKNLAPKHLQLLNSQLLKINSPELLFKKSRKRMRHRRQHEMVKKTLSKLLRVEMLKKKPLRNYLLKRSSLPLLLPLLRKRKKKETGGKNLTIPSTMMTLKPPLRKMSLNFKKNPRQNNQNSNQHPKKTPNLKSSSVFKLKKTAVRERRSPCVWLS